MSFFPRRSRIALLIAGLALVLAACSSQEPPATEPEPAPDPVQAPAEEPERDTEPPGAADWEEREPARNVLTADEINRMDVLRTIHFDYDESEIRPDQRPVLQDNAEWLREHPGVTILVEGHCDERGTREYNQALGERRAEAARQYLVSLGVDADRIQIISYGEERPVAQGSNEQAWARNRRADFRAVEVTR